MSSRSKATSGGLLRVWPQRGAHLLFGMALCCLGCIDGGPLKTAAKTSSARTEGEGRRDDGQGSPRNEEVRALRLAASKLGSSGAFVDFDGDGLLDQLVGAPHALYQGYMGVVLVHKGTSTGWESEPSTILRGDRDFGFSIGDVGDVDRDGVRDYAVGATHGDGEVALSGSVQVFAGGRRGAPLGQLGGGVPAGKFGWALAGGDFNGDGAADIAVGSPFHTPEPALYQSGAVFVFFGPSLTRRVDLVATSVEKGLGWSLAAGDIDADGIDDLLVSTRPGTGGKVLGFLGSRAFAPALDVPAFSVSATAAGFGAAMLVLDDLNGDGRRDLAIGAPTAAVGSARDTGSVYLVQTPRDATPVALDDARAPVERIARIDGPGLFSRFGAALAAMPDADGDGKRELLVGAPMADERADHMEGKVFAFRGSALGPRATLGSAGAFAGGAKFGAFGALVVPAPGGRLLVGSPRAGADMGGTQLVDLTQMRTVVAPPPTPASGAGGAPIHEHDEP